MKISKIIYNEVKQETTVYFKNGDSVKVKKSKDTEHDLYSAVSAAIVKYIYGSNTAFKKQLKHVEVINGKQTINLKDTSIYDMLFGEFGQEHIEKIKPHKFKVGDKVKFEDRAEFPREQKGVGVVVEVDGDLNLTYLIESEDIQEGHNGHGFEKGTYTSGNCWWFNEKHLQLIEKLEPFVEGEVVWFEDNKKRHYHLVRILYLEDEDSVWVKFINEECTMGYVQLKKLTRNPKHKDYTKD